MNKGTKWIPEHGETIWIKGDSDDIFPFYEGVYISKDVFFRDTHVVRLLFATGSRLTACYGDRIIPYESVKMTKEELNKSKFESELKHYYNRKE